MISIRLPERKWVFLIIALSLVNPLHYLFFIVNHPSDSVFIGFVDDGLMMSLMQSSSRNFSDPWSNTDIFHNPLVGSPYLFSFLGLPLLLINIPVLYLFLFYKFLFGVIYYLIAYYFINYFVKDKKITAVAFVLFMFMAGIGGLLYTLEYVVTGHNSFYVGSVLTSEFDELGGLSHSLTHLPRLYYLIPEILLYLLLLAYVAKRKFISGVLLGIAGLIYPMSFIVGISIIFLYTIFYKKPLTELFLVIIIGTLVIIPWFKAYTDEPLFFDVVKEESFANFSPIKIIVSYFLALPFLFYLLKKNRKLDLSIKFLFAWAGIFALISMIPPEIVHVFTARFGSMLLMPISILTAYGILLVSKRYKINPRIFILIILVVSFLSIAGFNTRIQKQGREEGLSNVYLSENDYNALLFLKTQPQGRIIASQKISIFTPVYSGQKAFFFSGRIKDNVDDYMLFYNSSTSVDTRNGIIRKYYITYIFYGNSEKKLNSYFLAPENAELIYDNGTQIYFIH